jgi:hypothetical protein
MKKDKIPSELFAKLKKETPLSKRTIYWRIQKKVNDYNCTITKRIATFLVAKDLSVNFTRFLNDEDREELRKASCSSQPGGGTTVKIIEKEKTKRLEPLRGINQIELFLPSSLLDEAKEMAEKAYAILYIFENSVRNIIRILMENKYGPNWWDLRFKKLHPNRDSLIDGRIKTEKQERWTSSKRGIHKIYYTDMDDLKMIIDDHWFIFKKIHKRKSWVIEHIMQLEFSRNIIAHNNPLKKRDITSIKTKILEWLDQIRELKI